MVVGTVLYLRSFTFTIFLNVYHLLIVNYDSLNTLFVVITCRRQATDPPKPSVSDAYSYY